MAKLQGGTPENWVNRFFGVFFFIFQLNQLFGNLISSLIIQKGFPDMDSLPEQNESEVEAIRNRCGLNFTAGDEGGCDSLEPLPDDTVYTLMGIYLGCGFIAFALVALFVDPLAVPDMEEKGSFFQLAQTTLRHTVKNKNQMLLIPLTIFSGLEQSFMMESFTVAYVSCTFGTGWIGFVMLVYGVTNAVCSFLCGIIESWIGRIPIFIFGGTLNMALMVTLLAEGIYPNPNHIEWYFMFAVGWGVCDAVWQCALNALYGVLFKDHQEAAFANYRLWESVGFCAAFGYGSVLNAEQKLYICVAFLIAGMIGYAAIEIMEKKRPQDPEKYEEKETGKNNAAFENEAEL